jgi:hypothetical protein
MKINEINFDEYRQYKINCLMYKSNGNDLITKNIMLYNLYDITKVENMKNVYIRKTKINGYNNYHLFTDFGFICLEHVYLNDRLDLDNIVKQIESLKYNEYNTFKKNILDLIDNNAYIRDVEIQTCKLSNESVEFIEKLVNYKKEYKQKQIEKEKAKEVAKQKENEIRLENEINELNELIKNSELKLLNKEKLYNDDIKVPYIDNDGDICYKDTTLMLYLFKINKISVPIKTKGWINDKLNYITYNLNLDVYSYSYNQNRSTVFFNYLEMLLEVLNKKHSIVNV